MPGRQCNLVLKWGDWQTGHGAAPGKSRQPGQSVLGDRVLAGRGKKLYSRRKDGPCPPFRHQLFIKDGMADALFCRYDSKEMTL